MCACVCLSNGDGLKTKNCKKSRIGKVVPQVLVIYPSLELLAKDTYTPFILV